MNWKILVSRYLARKYKLNESNLKMNWRITDLIKRNEIAILIDRVKDNPISATMIRNNPYKYWNKIYKTQIHN